MITWKRTRDGRPGLKRFIGTDAEKRFEYEIVKGDTYAWKLIQRRLPERQFMTEQFATGSSAAQRDAEALHRLTTKHDEPQRIKVAFWECPNRNPHGCKYIVTEGGHTTVMWIFPAAFGHKEIADQKNRGAIVSAGMIDGDTDDGPVCYGESTTLFKQARRKEDTEILRTGLKELAT